MPHFKVILSGRGIECSVDNDTAVGFFTTRLVKAPDLAGAERFAQQLVMSEWQPGGDYYASNRGAAPTLAVEESFQIGLLAGIFSRRPTGYSFYRHED